MRVNFFGNFDEAFFFLVKNGCEIANYFYQVNKESNSILSFCRKNGINYIEMPNSNAFNKNHTIKLLNGDILNIIASFGIIVPQNIVTNFLFINIHPGILPNYRGRHPFPQAILNKEKYGGITVHVVNPDGIDTGKILAIEKMEIDYNENYKYNELKLRGLIQCTLYKAINNLQKKYFIGEVTEGSYYKPIDQEILVKIFSAHRLADLSNFWRNHNV